MAWFDKPNNNPKYEFLFVIFRTQSGFLGHMGDYTYSARGPELKRMGGILKQFLNELESQSDLIQMTEPQYEEDPTPAGQRRVGGPIHRSEQIVFSALEEDLQNLCTDNPVHFICSTEIGVDDKNEFIRVIKFFTD